MQPRRPEKKEAPPKPISEAQGNAQEDDDEPDDWDRRIMDTGCHKENDTLRMCFVEKKDWRLCTAEMAAFRKCWDEHGNRERTDMKDL